MGDVLQATRALHGQNALLQRGLGIHSPGNENAEEMQSLDLGSRLDYMTGMMSDILATSDTQGIVAGRMDRVIEALGVIQSKPDPLPPISESSSQNPSLSQACFEDIRLTNSHRRNDCDSRARKPEARGLASIYRHRYVCISRNLAAWAERLLAKTNILKDLVKDMQNERGRMVQEVSAATAVEVQSKSFIHLHIS